MFQHVGGVDNIKRTLGERQRGSACLHRARARCSPMQAHLPGIGIDSDVRRAKGGKGIREVSGPATDVKQPGTVKRVEAVDLSCSIHGQLTIEAVGIGLLREERSEEAGGSAPRGPEGARSGGGGSSGGAHEISGAGGGDHPVTLPQRDGCTRETSRTYGGPMHIVVLNWRDTANPEGGGSEVYVEQLASRWARSGHTVTIVCAGHDQAPQSELRAGMRFVRVGSKLTVYSRARRLLRQGSLGHVDVVVDTQNGIPFFARCATTAPCVILVHHVHREQWPVVYDPLRARVGWFVESVVAPRVLHGSPYVAVSDATRRELIQQGVDANDITVVHNGTEPPGTSSTPKDPNPRVLVLGRLVPHKRVEHVIAAAARMRAHHPGLTVAVVGDGWWAEQLHVAAIAHGVADIIEFTGHVSEEEKARQLDRAWVLALPSLKEGWGLVVMEAASRGVPTVAYADAGGVTESILDGHSGVLVHGAEDAYASALDSLLADNSRRVTLGENARRRSAEFSWDASADAFASVLEAAVAEPKGSGKVSWLSRRRRKGRRP